MSSSLYYEKSSYSYFTPIQKVLSIIISSGLIILSLYFFFRDNSIHDNELVSIKVTLINTPEYYEYTSKSNTFREIIITTRQYQNTFKIKSMAYQSISHTKFKTSVLAGDTIDLKIKKSALYDLNKSDAYTEVYGIIKNKINYIDLDKKTKLENETDKRLGFFYMVMGLVILRYCFLKKEPMIGLQIALLIIWSIAFLLLKVFHLNIF